MSTRGRYHTSSRQTKDRNNGPAQQRKAGVRWSCWGIFMFKRGNSGVPALGSTHLYCDQQVSRPGLTALRRYCFWQQLCCWPLGLYSLIGIA